VSYRFLETRREGAVAELSLNRPEVRNAFNDGVIEELGDWAARTESDGALRVVVLSGRGKIFSAGADIEWMSRTRDYQSEDYRRDAEALTATLRALNELPQALVGRVQGAAIAGGAGLVSVCDIVVAAETAVFGFTEVKLGIVPAIISPFVLTKIGPSAARELFVTGERFSAARAREIGLVHRVVPEAELDAAVAAVVSELLTAAPGAVAAAKKLVREVTGLTPAAAAPRTAELIAERRTSAEARAGLSAFLEKKKPPWAR
jgi:methylglutaconyl-CoA hydratase